MPNHGTVPELELHPVTIRLLRHQAQPQRNNTNTTVNAFTGVMGGLGGMVASKSPEFSHTVMH